MAKTACRQFHRLADPLRIVPAPGQHEPRQQRMRHPASAAPHPRDPDQPITISSQMTLISVPPLNLARASRTNRPRRLDLMTELNVGLHIDQAGP